LLGPLLAAAFILACKGGAADPNTLVVLTHGPSGEVRFLQIGSGTITGRVTVGGEPHHLVRDTARGRVYVTDRAGDSVAVVDVLNRELVQRVRVGREPHFAALSPDSARLYVTVTGEGVLAIVNLETLAVSARVPVGNRPMGVAVSSDGSRVFVANDADETIAFVDPGQGRRAARSMPVPGGVHGGLALSSDGGTLLSGAMGRPSISAVAVATREVREVALGSAARDAHAPHNLLATPDGRFWVVALAGTSDVVALPTGGGEPVSIQVGGHPTGLAVAPGGRLLVTARDGDNLSEVDLEKGKVTRRMRVGPGHTDVTVFSRSVLDGLRAKVGG
jgi:YVTN family beta-propeller protein